MQSVTRTTTSPPPSLALSVELRIQVFRLILLTDEPIEETGDIFLEWEIEYDTPAELRGHCMVSHEDRSIFIGEISFDVVIEPKDLEEYFRCLEFCDRHNLPSCRPVCNAHSFNFDSLIEWLKAYHSGKRIQAPIFFYPRESSDDEEDSAAWEEDNESEGEGEGEEESEEAVDDLAANFQGALDIVARLRDERGLDWDATFTALTTKYRHYIMRQVLRTWDVEYDGPVP